MVTSQRTQTIEQSSGCQEITGPASEGRGQWGEARVRENIEREARRGCKSERDDAGKSRANFTEWPIDAGETVTVSWLNVQIARVEGSPGGSISCERKQFGKMAKDVEEGTFVRDCARRDKLPGIFVKIIGIFARQLSSDLDKCGLMIS